MARLATGCVLALALAMSSSASVAQDRDTCPELEQGIAQVRGADFSAAVLTLDHLARRLVQEGGSPKLLARTYVYLSIAYLGLSQVEQAKTTFLEALETDQALDLTASEFPPKYLEFFQEAQADPIVARTATETSEPAVEPEAVSKAGETDSPAPTTAVAGADSTKKGHTKVLLILGGVGAAAGIGVAVGTGGDEAPEESHDVSVVFSGTLGPSNPRNEHAFTTVRDGVIRAAVRVPPENCPRCILYDVQGSGGSFPQTWVQEGADVSAWFSAGPVALVAVTALDDRSLSYSIEVTYPGR